MSPRTEEQNKEIRFEKRELIMNVSLKLFAAKGYHSTSISQIARAAKISQGLLYSYFKSKEELLLELFKQYVKISHSLINPDDDDEITTLEMESFFDQLRKSLIENNDYWKLYSQLSVQPEVFNLLISQIDSGQIQMKHQELVMKYFAERFENPVTEAMMFQSLIKGFTIQYVFVPGMFGKEKLDVFFEELKRKYVREKK